MRALVLLASLLLGSWASAATGGLPSQVPQYLITAAEIAASVTPAQLGVAPCNLNRYGINTTPGTTDMSTALSKALLACTVVYIPSGTYLVGGITVPNTSGLVIYGDGTSTILQQKSGGVNVFNWATAGVVYPTVLQTIRDLTFNGTNGTAHTINTAGAGGLTLKNLFFQNLPTGASVDSIFVNGAAATVTHDTRLINIQIYNTSTGNAGIEVGPLVSDLQISQFIMNGNGAATYCIELDSGAFAIQMNDMHIYSAKTNNLFGAGSNNFMQISHSQFDTATNGDSVVLTSSGNIEFSSDYFLTSTVNNAVTLTNVTNTSFYNNMWFGPASSGHAVNETGTSNGNTYIGGNIGTLANWTAPVFSLVGATSAVCNIPGVSNSGGCALPSLVMATATQSITSSVTYTADTFLTLALSATKYYEVVGQLVYTNASGATGGGFKSGLSYTGTGGTFSCGQNTWNSAAYTPFSGSVTALTGSAAILISSAPAAVDSTGSTQYFSCIVYGGSVGGTLTLNWAQNASNATATVRAIGSYLKKTQLN